MARSRAYRWGEDGLAGVSDHQQRLCLGLALWNTRDPILKERLFGLTGPEGNHGEDVKEIYYYLDAVPSHAYLRMLYKYPQAAFPYDALVAAALRRGKADPEFELIETGVFDEDRYFDVFVEYAKHEPDDLLMRVHVVNRGPDDAPIVVIPQAWFRNTWSWGRWPERPTLRAQGDDRVELAHPSLGSYVLHGDRPDELAFCENDTNHPRLFGHGEPGYFKDGLHDLVVNGNPEAVNPARHGTKVGVVWRRTVPAHGEAEFRIRLAPHALEDPFGGFGETFDVRRTEADAFYDALHPAHLSAAAGPGRHDLEPAVLLLRYSAVARRRPGPAAAAARAPVGTQPRVAPPVQRRRHLDARQVGVSLVRRVGPRVPLRAARAGRRPDFAKRPAHCC
jgi:hypothetical protein